MPQSTPRPRSTPARPQEREPEARLRLSPDPYPQETPRSAYPQRHEEVQKIKSLSFWENTDQEAGEEDEWAERQSPAPFILVIIILVVASTLLWFLFQWASSENTSAPLIIPADTTPFKVRPENPGGMMIPHQDKLVYGRLSQNNTPQPIERLLPPPEQPMAPPQQQPYPYPQGYPQNPSQGQGYPASALPQGGQQQPPFQQGAQPYPPFQAQAPYPHPQQHPSPNQAAYGPPPLPSPHGTNQGMNHGQNLYGSPPPMPPAPLPSLAPSPEPGNLTAPKLSAVEGIKPALDEEEGDDVIPSDGHHELNELIAREAETPLRRPIKKEAGKPLKLMPLDPGKHKVQIASLPSRPMAEQEIKRLRMHHGPIFEDKRWNIQKVNLGPARGFTYRLVVGSFPHHHAAAKFCKKLRSEKIGCLVVAPASE